MVCALHSFVGIVIGHNDAMMGGMTLQELLRRYGITRPIELAHTLHIDRQTASLLWRGDRKFSAARALALYDAIGVPLEELLRAQAVPEGTPKGRPRKPRPPEE